MLLPIKTTAVFARSACSAVRSLRACVRAPPPLSLLDRSARPSLSLSLDSLLPPALAQRRTYTMAATLPPFALPAEPAIPAEHLTSTPALDLFKLAAAQLIVDAVPEIELEKAYEGVESGKTGKNVSGDFTVAVPRFRLKAKPNDIAEQIVQKVRPRAEEPLHSLRTRRKADGPP